MKRSSEKGDNSQDMSGMEKYAILLKDTPSASQLSHSHMDENQLAAYKRMKVIAIFYNSKYFLQYSRYL